MERLVAVVDDDIAVRESLSSLIRSVGMDVRVFASAEEFLTQPILARRTVLYLTCVCRG